MGFLKILHFGLELYKISSNWWWLMMKKVYLHCFILLKKTPGQKLSTVTAGRPMNKDMFNLEVTLKNNLVCEKLQFKKKQQKTTQIHNFDCNNLLLVRKFLHFIFFFFFHFFFPFFSFHSLSLYNNVNYCAFYYFNTKE